MLMRLRETLEQRGRSVSSHYRDIRDGLFTKPVSLGKKAVGWPADEIKALSTARQAGLSEARIRELVEELHAQRIIQFSRALEASSCQSFIEGDA